MVYIKSMTKTGWVDPKSLVATEEQQHRTEHAATLFAGGAEYVDPVVVADGQIIDGHNRVAAAIELGIGSIRCRSIPLHVADTLRAEEYDSCDIAAGVHEYCGDYEASSRIASQFEGSAVADRAYLVADRLAELMDADRAAVTAPRTEEDRP